MIEVVGAGAALCSMASFIPQAVKIWREQDARSVSRRMYAVTVAGFSLWTVYGMLLGSWPLVCSNLVSLGLSGWILWMTLRFGPKEGSHEKGPRTNPRP